MYLKLLSRWSKNAVSVNQLKWQVKEQHLNVSHRFFFQKVVCEVVDFPESDKERLQELTSGHYQLCLQTSSSFAKEHIKGDCDIHTHKDEGLLSISFPRHTNSELLQGSSSCAGCWHNYALMHHPKCGISSAPHMHNVNKSEYLTENPMPQQRWISYKNPMTGVPGNTVASEYGRSKNRFRKRQPCNSTLA